MLGTTDWVGLATFITALTGLIGVVLANVRTASKTQVDEVHAAVSTPPDAPTLGVLASETHDAVQEVVSGNTPPAGTPEVKP